MCIRDRLNLATVLEYTAHHRLFWESVEAKRIFGIPGKIIFHFPLTSVLSAAIVIDEVLLLAQRQGLHHDRALCQQLGQKATWGLTMGVVWFFQHLNALF